MSLISVDVEVLVVQSDSSLKTAWSKEPFR
jgi:hypothetical protein